MTVTREDIETALANGTLWAQMANGAFWRLRRNGATKTWKRAPERYSIPVKAGLKSCGRIDEASKVGRGPSLTGASLHSFWIVDGR